MPRASSARHLIAWIASLAILMGALAPAISHAVARGTGSSSAWAEICSALGAKLVRVDDDAGDQRNPAAPGEHAFQHCLYCSFHAAAPGLPPTSALELQLPLLQFQAPAPFLSGPATAFVWLSAQSRAPPVIS
ncbi:DUF2946 domain-containing protein [Rhizobacter sp. P5_C2]